MSDRMRMHLADIWETVADAIPEGVALVHGERRRTWRDYETAAAKLAAFFVDAGLKQDSKVAIYASNCSEYLEANFATLKFRGVPVNVNYRYLEDELLYILENSDAEAVVLQARFSPRLDAIRRRAPKLRVVVEIDDGSGLHAESAVAYEEVLAAAAPMPRIAHSEDDVYMFYTGGTTGSPKGVMYRMGDFCTGRFRTFATRGYATPQTAREHAVLLTRLQREQALPHSIPACPLMHATGLWVGAFQPQFLGGRIVTIDTPRFDAHALWQMVERERISEITFVGDAFARPMLEALREAEASGRGYDVSSVKLLVSSGVTCSAESKRGLLEFCDATIVDTIGSTEGAIGLSRASRETPPGTAGSFTMNPTTRLFSEDGREIAPGSAEIGMIATGGVVPLGYFKDPERSARTFRTVNGQRYTFGGDHARLLADGTLEFLGRGSNCINTAGEKVFPEEVEDAIKSLEGVTDCLVVGLPDNRLGQRVTAVVSLAPGSAMDETRLISAARAKIASYKLPKRVIFTAAVERAPNGKPDYVWARSVAEAALSARPQRPPERQA